MRGEDLFARFYAEHPEIHEIAAEVDPPFILAANVIDLRRARGLTQAALAEKVGIAQPRIAEIEAGDANPRLRTLTRLAVALGVTVGDLLHPPPDFAIAPHESAEDGAPDAEASAEPAPRRRRVG